MRLPSAPPRARPRGAPAAPPAGPAAAALLALLLASALPAEAVNLVSTVAYDGNGATSGTAPAPVTVTNSAMTIAANPFARTEFLFSNWSTQANGGGSSFWPGNVTNMPTGLTTLYAQWTPDLDYPLSAADDYYTGQFRVPFVMSGNTSVLNNDGPSVFPLSVRRLNGVTPGTGTLTINRTTSEIVFTPSRSFGASNMVVYYGGRWGRRGPCVARRAAGKAREATERGDAAARAARRRSCWQAGLRRANAEGKGLGGGRAMTALGRTATSLAGPSSTVWRAAMVTDKVGERAAG